jgi:hypothetical protein
MYAGLRTSETLHKKPRRIGPGICATSENAPYAKFRDLRIGDFVKANFGECPKGEVRRIHILSTSSTELPLIGHLRSSE